MSLHQQQREYYMSLHKNATLKDNKLACTGLLASTTKRKQQMKHALTDAASPKSVLSVLFDELGINQAIAGTKTQTRHLADTTVKINSGLDHPFLRVGRRLSVSATYALEVTGIRYERVNSIVENDAIAEGVEIAENANEDLLSMIFFSQPRYVDYSCEGFACLSAVKSFQTRWQARHGSADRSWYRGAWVWVIEFKAVTK